mgnify:CR=1 FL=1
MNLETAELVARWIIPFYSILLFVLAWRVFKEKR